MQKAGEGRLSRLRRPGRRGGRPGDLGGHTRRAGVTAGSTRW
ncbi:hypothetical protein MSMEG_0648 [Mycolicibacterium smegmatis MC2 155]|uniref:Uncharacterized protein n=1 Tax=Mycolicibacterium smegmatis (strain ATCC 700084 / mc(2)155) TaxID=246196 RepID=A0QQ69_MYCS2|nr:hypothetical protein MSMEG_0648 [Mycolicibacterium smegmatis MC2 155]